MFNIYTSKTNGGLELKEKRMIPGKERAKIINLKSM